MTIDENKKLSSSDLTRLLRQTIANGEFSPQDRLPSERVLSERFGTARGTVRSALAKLEREGVVETRPGSGTYVVGEEGMVTNQIVANASPLELIDSRFALEPHSCRLAVLNARGADFEKLDALMDEMENAADNPAKFSELDTRFHALIAETTGNSLLIWIVAQINSVRNQEQWSLMRHLTLNKEMIHQYNLQHREIIAAIKSREPERAAQLMKNHLESARLSLTRSAAT